MKRRSRKQLLAVLALAVLVASQMLAVTIRPSAAAPGDWTAEYFDNPTLSGAPVLTRAETSIDNDWGAGSPDASVPVNEFSARWTATIDFNDATYRFTTFTDDGVRLYVDGQLVIDKFVGQSPTEWQADVPLTAGPHTVVMEYFEGFGDAVARLTYAPIVTEVPEDAWLAEFFGNRDLANQPVASRADTSIDFDWGAASPELGVPVNNFSVRWSRTVDLDTAGTYRLRTETDDGVRVYVDGNLVIDDWNEQAPTVNQAEIELTAGPHAFVVEYFDAFGDALARFSYGLIQVELPPDAWLAELFTNPGLTGDPIATRVDPVIDFEWGPGAPQAGMPIDNFSVRWTREADLTAGTYRFQTVTDDGVRVYVDGNLVIDDWEDQSTAVNQVDVDLAAGTHTLVMEYYEAFGDATAKLIWGQVTEAGPLPPGFSEDTVITGLVEPTTFRIAPDGRVFVAEKSGVIKVFDGLDDPTPTVFADLNVNVFNFWDRGLLGLELHPQFPTVPYVYVAYSYDHELGSTDPAPRWGTPGVYSDTCPTPPGATVDGCVTSSRVSRLTADGNVMAGTEQVLVEDWCEQFQTHSIGDLAFGPDGALYVSGGEGANSDRVDYGQYGVPVNPCGDPPGGVGGSQTAPTAEGGALRSQDLLTPGDPVSLGGTVIRIDPETGEGMPDNPLASDPDANARRIIAHGLRNPFRIAIRPGTNEVWLGDVGWGSYEEINRVPDAANVHNFGWPCYESGNRQATWDAQDLDMCENLYAQGPAAVTAPVYSYSHKLPIVPGENCLNGSSSTSGLAFYQGGNYPDEYDGALFLADYSRGCIWTMFPGTDGVPDPATIAPFATPAAFPVDLQIGPGGDLFYVDITGSIRRVEYTTGTTPPNAVVTATPTSGSVPLAVSFDASGSGDPDFGDTISFDWDLDGDGVFGDSTSATPSFTYTQPGTYVARVRVTDNHGAFDDASVTIDAGNSPPVASIATPLPTTTWKVGDTISFSGSAVDDEDGPLPASALTWTVVLHHCGTTCHTHPVQTFTGVSSGSFVAPDHAYPSYLELVLTATDSGGLKHTQSRRLDPQIVTLSFESDPSGMQIAVGDTASTTPFTREAIVGSTVTIGALSPQTVGGVTYDFESWSDGGAGGHDIVVGASAATYTATYAGRPPVADAGADKTVDSGKSFTLDATGSSQPGGGALGYLWTQIGGPPAVIRDEDQAVTVVEGVTGPATLTFRVTATGPSGLTDTDDVVVTVKKPK